MKQFIFLFSFLLLCSLCPPLQAQTLSGTVTDVESGRPLDAVMVSVLRGGVLTDYALTDAQGKYALPWKRTGTLQLRVSMLGYRAEVRNVSSSGQQNFRLRAEAIVLKEVQIRGGRVYGRKDTVRYDLSQFASSRDVHIKDVLKRLPGVEVEESGQVKYKGKPIDHFLVEGMDVTGGRYNQVNNNLGAKAVKTAEIMENYQSVKALKGKINSEEVALNLQLDPKARDQWIVNGTLGVGWSNGGKEIGSSSSASSSSSSVSSSSEKQNSALLWEGSLSALQLGKGRQSLYNYKTNNNGTDLSTEQTQFTDNNGDDPGINLLPLLAQPGITAPLDKQRLLFNQTHTLNGNRMYKWTDERSLRLQAGYTHDRLRRQRGNSLTYYQPEDTIHIDETYHYRLQSDAAYAEAHYEDNAPGHYLSNRFKAEGTTERGTSPELQQQIHTSQLKATNQFHLLRNREANTWEINSAMQYAYLPSSLQVAGGKEQYRQQSFYADNSAGYLHKHNGFTQQVRAGLQGEWGKLSCQSAASRQSAALGSADVFLSSDISHSSDIHGSSDILCSSNVSNLSLYLTPSFQLERGKWFGSLSLPFRGKRYFGAKENYLLYAPSLYLRYNTAYHWKFSLFAGLNRSAGSSADLYPFTYRTDYRTWYTNNGLTPVSLTQNCQLYGEYKNTVQEFFVTASLNYQRLRQNTLYEQSVSQDSIVYTRRHLPHRTENWSFTGTLSKGFYTWHLKTSLDFSLSRTTGKQLINRLLQTYRYDYLKAEPKLIWLPCQVLEAEYHATIGYGGSKISTGVAPEQGSLSDGSKKLKPLLDVVQRLHLTFSLGQIDLRLSGEHYRNDLGNGTHLNTVFADASLIYKVKKWRLEATLNNLFNKKEYAYTLYSATQSSTSRLNIRPREAMLTASYQF